MYERFFGLTDRPFEVTPDSKFLFLTQNYLEVMNTMLSGIRDHKGLMVVTGEVGTGKTILVHSVLERLEEGVKSAFIFHTTVTFEELLKAVLVELEQPIPPRKDEKILWEELVQYSKQVAAQEETLAIIIDEAHKLDEDVLDKLLQRVTEPRSRHIQMILVGQPELEKKLEFSAVIRLGRSGTDRRKFSIPVYSPERRSGQERRGSLRERMEVWLDIKPLTDEESRRYIEHRLRLCGGKTSELFTEEAVNLLCHQAQGIPRVLNILCDNTLLTAYGLSKQQVDVDVVYESIRALEGARGKKVLPFFHSLISHRMQTSFWKVLLAGFLLLCLAGLFVWLHRDSGRSTSETSTRGIIQKSTPGAPLPATPAKTDQKSEKEGTFPTVPVQTGKPSTETLSTPSSPETRSSVSTSVSQDEMREPVSVAALSKPAGHEMEGVEGLTSSVGIRGNAEFEEIVTVKAGVTIFELCRRYYGFTNATLMDIVLDFNPGLENAHLIRVNQKIKLPRITEDLLVLENPNQTYHIHAGTYADPGSVRRYRSVSALNGKDIEIVPRKVSPEDTWYRVVIGRFDTRDEALRMIRLLKGRGLVPSSRRVSNRETPEKPEAP